jgi:hypothetical protein
LGKTGFKIWKVRSEECGLDFRLVEKNGKREGKVAKSPFFLPLISIIIGLTQNQVLTPHSSLLTLGKNWVQDMESEE